MMKICVTVMMSIAVTILAAERITMSDAVYDGSPEWMREAIRNGGNVNEVDSMGYTCFMSVVHKQHPAETVRIMIEAGADVHATSSSSGKSALHLACECLSMCIRAEGNEKGCDKIVNMERIVRLLVEAGADVSQQCKIELTPWELVDIDNGRYLHKLSSDIKKILKG